MWRICSFNFTGWGGSRLDIELAKAEIDEMISRCKTNTVTICLGATQEHTYSTVIDWRGPHMLEDYRLVELIEYAQGKGQKVILKPMVNPRDGYWRAFIRFFDEDVPCEPKWSEWFASYTQYMVHYAHICETMSVDMLIVGCELVGTDHRSKEWRELVKAVRQVYTGLLTYNCDKYQEHNVSWWDALDAISSSGYYPVDDWDNQIARVEAVVKEFNLPFFFSEVGCPSTEGASMVPNDWHVIGKCPVSLNEQDLFFRVMFEKCSTLDWHYGYCIWDWNMNANLSGDHETDGGYSVIGKPAQSTIATYYSHEPTERR